MWKKEGHLRGESGLNRGRAEGTEQGGAVAEVQGEEGVVNL